MSTALATRVLAGPPVMQVGRLSRHSDAEFMEVRERKGLAAFTTYAEARLPIRYAEGQRLLTNAELWLVEYQRVIA